MNKILIKFFDFKKNNNLVFAICFFTIVSAILTPIFCYNFNCNYPVKHLDYDFLAKFLKINSFFLSSIIISIFYLIFIKLLYFEKLQKIIIIIVYTISSFAFILNSYCIFNFKIGICPELLRLIINTYKKESLEFLHNYFSFYSIIQIIILLILPILIYKYSSYFYKKMVNILKYISIISLAIILFFTNKYFPNKSISVSTLPPIFTLLTSISVVKKAYYAIKILSLEKKNKVKILSDESYNSPLIIFVIGESESKHFMGIYNKKYNNTPLCQKLVDDGNMFFFTNVVSKKSITICSTLVMTSFAEDDCDIYDIISHSPLIDVFKKSGYQTFWLSNQNEVNELRSYIDFQAHRFAYYTNITTNKDYDEDSYDEELLYHFDNYLKNLALNNKKNYFAFHLYGSHSIYEKRYPIKFKKYDISDIVFDSYNHKMKKEIADYLNSILYTDYIINEIINRIKDKNAVLIYAPDHAEKITSKEIIPRTSYPHKKMLEIPMLIYMSDSYMKKHSKLVKSIKKSLNKPFMTNNLPHVILDLAGITTHEYDATKSVINEKYIQRPRYIFDTVYEELED